MSNVARVAGQAANTLVKPLEVEDVFSTYLYTGTGANQTITNGIDLSGEGGLVWTKNRDAGWYNHVLVDSARGTSNSPYISSNNTNAQATDSGGISQLNSNGYTIGSGASWNATNDSHVSWTFRKAPKFFDVVTYTGNGTANRSISHNLGSTPGCIIVKGLDNAFNWQVFHRSLPIETGDFPYILSLNTTGAQSGNQTFYSSGITSTEFEINYYNAINQSGQEYVAYLFAHNDGDGEFGPDGDADIIKCGSYTGNGSGTAGPTVDLGFEPQWILTKRTDSTGYWTLVDAMRGMVVDGDDKLLYPNSADAEQQSTRFVPSATGFQVNSTNGYVNASGGSYIYIAIRRGTAVPTSATEVFDVQTSTSANFVHTTGFDVDLAITGSQDGWARNAGVVDRLRGDGKSLETSNTDAESAGNAGVHEFDRSREYLNSSTSGDQVAWAWKRAPNYFDVVTYTGNGTAGRTVSHNLGVAPEMMWVRKRNSAGLWRVYHKGLNGGTNPEQYGINLNETSAEYDLNTLWNDTAPTASVFSLGTQGNVNGSSATYIAYLFATLAGISKVGSYTGSSSSVDVDCGFTSGARFVLVKRTDSTGSWYVWDSERGIVAGNDPYLILNSTTSEITGNDFIDPLSSGFTVNTGSAAINTSGGSYIFYAIA